MKSKLYGKIDDRSGYRHCACTEIKNKKYYIKDVYFYDCKGVFFNLNLFETELGMCARGACIEYFGKTNRRLKPTFNGENFIIKNNQGWSNNYYDLYIYCGMGNYITLQRKYITDNVLYYEYSLCGYKYMEPVKDFNNIIDRRLRRIRRESKLIQRIYREEMGESYPFIDDEILHLLLLEDETLSEKIKKHLTKIKTLLHQIKRIKKSMKLSTTFNQEINQPVFTE